MNELDINILQSFKYYHREWGNIKDENLSKFLTESSSKERINFKILKQNEKEENLKIILDQEVNHEEIFNNNQKIISLFNLKNFEKNNYSFEKDNLNISNDCNLYNGNFNLNNSQNLSFNNPFTNFNLIKEFS